MRIVSIVVKRTYMILSTHHRAARALMLATIPNRSVLTTFLFRTFIIDGNFEMLSH